MRSVTFWLALLSAAIYALHAIPVLGVLLILVGIPIWLNIALNLTAGSLIVEASIGRIPRWSLVPFAAAFLVNGAFAIADRVQMRAYESDVRMANAEGLVSYDPAIHFLEVQGEGGSGLVQNYRVPIAYERNPYVEGATHLAYRLLSGDACERGRFDFRDPVRIGLLRADGRGGDPEARKTFLHEPCVFSAPEMPTGTPLRLYSSGKGERRVGTLRTEESVLSAMVGDEEAGSYRTVVAHPRSFWPVPHVVCFRLGPDDRCEWWMPSSSHELDIVPRDAPDGLTNDLGSRAAGMMLMGIEPYEPGDWDRLERPGDNVAVLRTADAAPDATTDRAFEVLDAILDGEDVQPFVAMDIALARDPERLSERAPKLPAAVAALDRCMGPGGAAPVKLDQRDRKRSDRCIFLVGLSAWLADDALEPIARDLLAVIQIHDQLYRMDHAYIRLADFVRGPSDPLFADYADLAASTGSSRLDAIMGLCRIGSAPSDVVERMKGEFVAEGSKGYAADRPKSWFIHKALFLALVSFGEREFAASEVPHLDASVRDWYERVLDGDADSPRGPNRCIPHFGNRPGFTPPALVAIIET